GEGRVEIGQQGRPFLHGGLRPITDMCPPSIRRRSGFTREYGSGGIAERRVEIGQQARPLRGLTRSYDGLCPATDNVSTLDQA
ncbi:MAG: hypothetical protein WB494_18195, partial [Pseudomonas alloputida]